MGKGKGPARREKGDGGRGKGAPEERASTIFGVALKPSRPAARTTPAPPSPFPLPPSQRLDERRLARLRWRCRRGMLENDLVLAHYLDARAEAITEDEAAMLDRLLELSDNALWDVIAGIAEPEDPTVAPMVAWLRRPLRMDEPTTPEDAR